MAETNRYQEKTAERLKEYLMEAKARPTRKGDKEWSFGYDFILLAEMVPGKNLKYLTLSHKGSVLLEVEMVDNEFSSIDVYGGNISTISPDREFERLLIKTMRAQFPGKEESE